MKTIIISIALVILVFFHQASVWANPNQTTTEQGTVQNGGDKTEEEQVTQAQALSFDIQSINEEILALSENLESATGEDFGAIQLQLFYKNIELRKDIDKAFNSDKYDSADLKALVDGQIDYADQAIEFLENRASEITEALTALASEEKIEKLNRYQELQSYLDLIYEWSEANLEWLTKLGIDTVEAKLAHEAKLKNRLRLLSASINYYNRQREVIGQQVSASPESEHAKLQLSQLIVTQRLTIAITSMRAMVKLANNSGFQTAQYQKLIFESTGEVTYELLDVKVLAALISHMFEGIFSWLGNNGLQFLFKLLIFIIIVFLASKVAKITSLAVERATNDKRVNMSHLMRDFFVTMSGRIVFIIGVMIGLSQVGLDMTPVLAGFGIASIIIGFALQDTLSNLASGMMLLIYKPFDVGDFVHAGGVDGKVGHMSLVNTTIRTFDNQIIIIPNSKIWGDVIKNVTQERIRRVDMVFSIGYKDSIEHAEEVLQDIVQNHPNVLKSPETMIKVHTLNTSSVDFIVRPWVRTEFYWDVYWDITRAVKLRFDREGISIPFPQQDVHLYPVQQVPPPQ